MTNVSKTHPLIPGIDTVLWGVMEPPCLRIFFSNQVFFNTLDRTCFQAKLEVSSQPLRPPHRRQAEGRATADGQRVVQPGVTCHKAFRFVTYTTYE